MATAAGPSGNAHDAEKKGWVSENMGALYRMSKNKIRPGVYRKFDESENQNTDSLKPSIYDETTGDYEISGFWFYYDEMTGNLTISSPSLSYNGKTGNLTV